MPEHLVFCDQDTLERRYLRELVEHGRVPQNLFYLLDGARVFYSYRGEDVQQIAWEDECEFFSEQPIWCNNSTVAFISLGCGNAGPEKMLLRSLSSRGSGLHYVGVDSSRRMVELAAETLKGEAYQQSFVLADFSAPDFPDRLEEVAGSSDARIYAMIGGTFGNFEQVYIADLLSRLVPTGAYLYLDVVPIEASARDNRRLRHRLSNLPKNLGAFFDRMLDALGLPKDAGEVVRVDRADRDLRTMRFTFSYRATDRIVLSCVDAANPLGSDPLGSATLEPGQMVELFTVRAYDTDSLNDFLGERGFSFVGRHTPDVGNLSHRWERLLLQKV